MLKYSRCNCYLQCFTSHHHPPPLNSYILYKMSARKENKMPTSQFMFVQKLGEQLVSDFHEGVTLKLGRPSPSDKDESLNRKLHILRHIIAYIFFLNVGK